MKLTAVVIALCLATLLLPAALPGVIGGPIRNPSNGHVYYLLEAATWHESQATAAILGGDLVTINNRAENEWVAKIFGIFNNVERHLWIGLTDRAREDDFSWVDGALFRFSNWGAGEPNNSGALPGQVGYEEDFVYIIAGATVWNDVPADGYGAGEIHGVVEIDPKSFRRFRFNHPANVRPGGLGRRTP